MGEFELHFSVFGVRAQELLGWYQDYLEKKLQGVSRAGNVIQYLPGFDHHSIGTYELNDRDRFKQSEIRGSVEWLLNQEPNKLYQFIVEKGLIDTLHRAISERNRFLEPIIMQQVKDEPGRAAFSDMPTEERAEYSLNRELQDWLNQKESEVTPADKADDNQGQQQKKFQLIEWRDTKEQLERLAGELKKQGFIDDADIFAGQFQCERFPVAKEPCQWLDDSVLLVYLFDRLKQEKFINKKNNPDRLLSGHFTDYETGKPVENIRSARNNYRNNSKTLTGKPNLNKDGVPSGAEKIEKILGRIT